MHATMPLNSCCASVEPNRLQASQWDPAPHMCLMKGSCRSTVATRPFMGAGTCVSGSPHSGNDNQLPILPTHMHSHNIVSCLCFS